MARALLIAALLAGCAAAPELRRPDAFQRGVALGLFPSGEPGEEAAYEERLDEIRALGARDVSLVVTWVQDDVAASEVRADPRYSASPALLARLIRAAHRLGMRVLLFPVVRLLHRTPAEWRGTIHPRDLGQWFATYRRMLLALARLGEAERAELLCVGSELGSLEAKETAWRGLIAHTRSVYSGQLIYSANWDRYHAVPFWSALDRVGVSAYWELSPEGTRPTIDEVSRAWRPIRARLASFRARVGRPLLLTEVGYPSVRGAGAHPWNDFLTGPAGEPDDEAQRRLYEAFVSSFTGEASVSGVYFWLWFSSGGRGDGGYTPRGKPAEYVLRAWYRDRARLPAPR